MSASIIPTGGEPRKRQVVLRAIMAVLKAVGPLVEILFPQRRTGTQRAHGWRCSYMLQPRRFITLCPSGLINAVIGGVPRRIRLCELQNYIVSPFTCTVIRHDSRTVSESISPLIDVSRFRIGETDRLYSCFLKTD